jgi:hypothetical protein
MTHEFGGQNTEMFSEDELTSLASKVRAFAEVHAEPVNVDAAAITADGGLISITSSYMPHFALGNRSISVTPPHDSLSLSIQLTDELHEPESDTHLLIGRQLSLNEALFDQFFYQTSLQMYYSEYPADAKGRPVLPADRKPGMPEQVSKYRPFSHGDYQDILAMLDAGLE